MNISRITCVYLAQIDLGDAWRSRHRATGPKQSIPPAGFPEEMAVKVTIYRLVESDGVGDEQGGTQLHSIIEKPVCLHHWTKRGEETGINGFGDPGPFEPLSRTGPNLLVLF